MTDRAEIERLLNQTGRTLEGLPTQDDYWYSDDYVDRNKEIGMMMYRSGFILNEPYIMHQSDVIELLVGALRDALDKRTKWISVEERLPGMYEDGSADIVLVTDGQFIHMAAYSNEKWYFAECGEMKEPMFYKVSHWMPLPKPPKEERK